jgi:phenylpropionate dioxygenase-like ring-hydroxylating dioxygenase large terminal subunit
MGTTDRWLRAVPTTDVEQPGSYATFEAERESYLVLNDRGTVRVFYNVCQHRGHPLCDPGAGHVKTLRCPYHGWTYGLDGRLRHVPDLDTFEGGVPMDRFGLEPVVHQLRDGFVWIERDR